MVYLWCFRYSNSDNLAELMKIKGLLDACEAPWQAWDKKFRVKFFTILTTHFKFSVEKNWGTRREPTSFDRALKLTIFT